MKIHESVAANIERTIDAAVVKIGIVAIVADFVEDLLNNPIAAASEFAHGVAGIRLHVIAIVAIFEAFLNDTITTCGHLATVGAGVGVDGITIIAPLAGGNIDVIVAARVRYNQHCRVLNRWALLLRHHRILHRPGCW